MIDGLTLGAYAAEPRRPALDERSERRWFQALAAVEGAHGLEVFFRGTLHPRGPEHLAQLLPEGWHLVVTALPQAIAGSTTDPRYGLASKHADGRHAAVDDIRRLLAETRRLDAVLGRTAVRAIELHSAPRAIDGVSSDASALALSLRELTDAAEGTPLIVEHCDALVAGQAPIKGYLSLAAEQAAVDEAQDGGAVSGQSVNWGRSAIEGRSARTPVEHVRHLVRAGTLSGLMFSGAPSTAGPLGAAWDDLHNPLRSDDPASLLDGGGVGMTLAEIDAASWDRMLFLGAKVQDPEDSVEFERRLAPLTRAIGAIRAGMEKR
ncbi:DUF4862 family protein [Microbacterium sp. Se5.02b]|uniref:DUF4862 family protein n=1 Tax=Microbacterium sp. Se5.02b TaxID=2864103 RepID=UPI001C692FDA|nr:DUF4862 family protein [Microbacterium sp. Se5.02b]QYM64071.1 DUF4862 family protein [Microbacterium sp. Se5.02b]